MVDVDKIADGATYFRTTGNEKTGGGRAYSGLNSSNRLVTGMESGSTIVYTPAQIAVPSSYYLDLRCATVAGQHYKRLITCDYASLKDGSGNTFAVGAVNVTVDITVVQAANGRDQYLAFTTDSWIHFYIIGGVGVAVAGLASASPTSPSLPSGYTYFMRVGACWVDNNGYIDTFAATQINDMVFYGLNIIIDHAHSAGDGTTWDSESLAQAIPVTAKSVFGYFGASTNPIANRGMAIAANSSGQHLWGATIDGGAVVYNPRSNVFFWIPVLAAQTIYWTASIIQAYFYLSTHGYIDDI